MVTGAVGAGSLALGAAGALIVVVVAFDMFLTIFNYDGFSTLSTRFHHGLWRLLRTLSRPLPSRARHSLLSVGSAGMLPATVALWLGLEITGFALMFEPGLAGGHFSLHRASASLGTGFYLSAGAVSSLTFGDVTAVGALQRALVDLETILGLATFTLALGYVVTTFGTLGALEDLHGRVRRHAEDPEQPSSILSRHFAGGSPQELPSLLQELGDSLEEYDRGLRRYPVVYYFHTRRPERSIPHVFTALGDLLALLRFGLPPDEPIADDPFLAALLDGYATTLQRLRRSFVGPKPFQPPAPLPRERFEQEYASGGATRDEWVVRFERLQRRARTCARLEDAPPDEPAAAFDRYRDWLPFEFLERVVLDRVADRLGYAPPSSA